MLDSNFFHSLLTNLNAEQSPSFTWGVGAPEAADLALRLARRAALNLIDVERACVLLIAEFAGLKVDRDIGRGEIPARNGDGFAVKVVGETPEADPDVRTFEVLCFGKAERRDAVTEPLARLAGKLPLRGAVTVGSRVMAAPVTLGAFHLSGRYELSTVADEGKKKTLGVLPITATVITSRPIPLVD